MNPSQCVVLNSTYEPINVTKPKRGLVLVLAGKAQTLKTHDVPWRTSSEEYYLPATILMNYYIPTKRIYSPAVLNNRNLFIRDGHTCAYCRREKSKLRKGVFLTRDHVHPKVLGGKNVWNNVVAACSVCNNKKGDILLKNLPDMKLHVSPYTPTVFEIYVKGHYENIDLTLDNLIS